jgi:hypothetical protein
VIEGDDVTVWLRLVAVATWGLIGIFTALTVAHVVLTVLFYVGVHETGHGFFLEYEWPSWLITIIDALVVLLVLVIRRERAAKPSVALWAGVVATALVVGRALWMVLAPAFAAVLVVDAIRRMAESRQPA